MCCVVTAQAAAAHSPSPLLPQPSCRAPSGLPGGRRCLLLNRRLGGFRGDRPNVPPDAALVSRQLDWMSTDEYYDVSVQHYRAVYEARLYPHLRPEQRVVQ